MAIDDELDLGLDEPAPPREGAFDLDIIDWKVARDRAAAHPQIARMRPEEIRSVEGAMAYLAAHRVDPLSELEIVRSGKPQEGFDLGMRRIDVMSKLPFGADTKEGQELRRRLAVVRALGGLGSGSEFYRQTLPKPERTPWEAGFIPQFAVGAYENFARSIAGGLGALGVGTGQVPERISPYRMLESSGVDPRGLGTEVGEAASFVAQFASLMSPIKAGLTALSTVAHGGRFGAAAAELGSVAGVGALLGKAQGGGATEGAALALGGALGGRFLEMGARRMGWKVATQGGLKTAIKNLLVSSSTEALGGLPANVLDVGLYMQQNPGDTRGALQRAFSNLIVDSAIGIGGTKDRLIREFSAEIAKLSDAEVKAKLAEYLEGIEEATFDRSLELERAAEAAQEGPAGGEPPPEPPRVEIEPEPELVKPEDVRAQRRTKLSELAAGERQVAVIEVEPEARIEGRTGEDLALAEEARFDVSREIERGIEGEGLEAFEIDDRFVVYSRPQVERTIGRDLLSRHPDVSQILRAGLTKEGDPALVKLGTSILSGETGFDRMAAVSRARIETAQTAPTELRAGFSTRDVQSMIDHGIVLAHMIKTEGEKTAIKQFRETFADIAANKDVFGNIHKIALQQLHVHVIPPPTDTKDQFRRKMAEEAKAKVVFEQETGRPNTFGTKPVELTSDLGIKVPVTTVKPSRFAQYIEDLARVKPEWVKDALDWYHDSLSVMRSILSDPAQAEEILTQWAIMQKSTTTYGGTQNLIRGRGKYLAGVPTTKKSYLSERSAKALNLRLAGTSQESIPDTSRKLWDFLDALFGKLTRSWHGDEPGAGLPVVMDKWMHRAIGWIDAIKAKSIKKRFGVDVQIEKMPDDTSSSERSYEWGARYLDEVWQRLVKRNKLQSLTEDPRPVTPVVVQALVWISESYHFGVPGESIQTAWIRNIREVTASAIPAPDSPLGKTYLDKLGRASQKTVGSLSRQVMETAAKATADFLGVLLPPQWIVHSSGAWLDPQGAERKEPASTIRGYLLEDQAKDFADILGLLTEQQSVLLSKPIQNGRSSMFSVEAPRAEVEALIGELRARGVLKNYSIVPMGDSSRLWWIPDKADIKATKTAIAEMESARSVEVSHVDFHLSTNDWSTQAKGEGYEDSLRGRGERSSLQRAVTDWVSRLRSFKAKVDGSIRAIFDDHLGEKVVPRRLEPGIIAGLGPGRVRALQRIGIDSIQALAAASPASIAQAFYGSEALASGMISKAKDAAVPETGLALPALSILPGVKAIAKGAAVAWHKFEHSKRVKLFKNLFKEGGSGLPDAWRASSELMVGEFSTRLSHIVEQMKKADRIAADAGWDTPDKAAEIEAAMKGEVTYEDLGAPPELTNALIKLRLMHDSLSVELAHTGIVNPDLRETILSRLGIYLHRWYKIHRSKQYAEWIRSDDPNAVSRRGAAVDWIADAMDRHALSEQFGPEVTQALDNAGIRRITDLLDLPTKYVQQDILDLEGVEDVNAADLLSSARDFVDTQFPIAFRRMWDIIDQQPGWWTVIGGGDKIKDLSNLKRRSKIPSEIRELLGEVHDWRMLFFRSSTLMLEEVLKQQHLSRLWAHNRGLPFDDPGRFFWTKEEATELAEQAGRKIVQLQDSDAMKWGELKGLYVSEDVRDAIEQITPSRKDRLDVSALMAKAAAGIKVLLVPLNFPAGHVRNTLSNIAFGVNAGHLRPDRMMQAVQTFLGRFSESGQGRAEWDNLLALGLLDHEVNSGEFKEALDRAKAQEKAMLDPRVRRIFDEVVRDKSKLGAGLIYLFREWMLKPAFGSFKFADDIWKLYGFYEEKARGYSDQDAVDLVKNTYPSYDRAWLAARRLSRFPLTADFPTFTAEVLRVTWNQFKYAWREARGRHPLTGAPANRRSFARAIGMALNAGLAGVPVHGGASVLGRYVVSPVIKRVLGYGDEDLEPITPEQDVNVRRFLAPWEKNAELVHVGRERKSGDFVFFDLSYIYPYSFLGDAYRAIVMGEGEKSVGQKLMDGIAEMTSPFWGWSVLMQELSQVVLNRDERSGERIIKETDDPDDVVETLISKVIRKVPALRGIQRVAQGLTGEVTTFRPHDPKEELLGLFGFRPRRVKPEVSLSFRVKELGEALSEIDDPILRRWSRRPYQRGITQSELEYQARIDPIPGMTDEIRSQWSRMEAKRRRLFAQGFGLLEAARALGLSNDQILRTFEGSKIRKGDQRALMEGRYEPFSVSDQWRKIYWERVEETMSERR